MIENIPQFLHELVRNMTNFAEYSLGDSCRTSEYHMLNKNTQWFSFEW